MRLVDMDISSVGLRGTIGAFLRPEPYAQPALAALQHEIPRDAFSGQRAIVIGGTRGLGELAAKLLTVGGAAVTITWRRGETEALAIAAEAAAAGSTMEILPFDIVAPPDEVPAQVPFTHLYYFATPPDPGRSARAFQASDFCRDDRCICLGFCALYRLVC